MNIEEYIASGILESYALGHTSHSENALLECLVKTNPVVAKELKLIQENLEILAQENAIEPKATLKNQIWNAIQDDQNPVKDEKPIIQMEAKTFDSKKWFSIAASVLFILGIGSSLYFFNISTKKSEELSSLKKVNIDLKQKVDLQTKKIAFLGKSTTKKVVLKGVENKENYRAVAHWCELTKKLVLAEIQLPEPNAEKQYQLWAIVDGKPVDAGLLNSSAKSDLLDMKAIENSQAFAITLEPKGGSASPHLEDLCVMGEVK